MKWIKCSERLPAGTVPAIYNAIPGELTIGKYGYQFVGHDKNYSRQYRFDDLELYKMFWCEVDEINDRVKQYKNFDVKLKAAIDLRMEAAGIFKCMLEFSRHYDEYKDWRTRFFDSLDDITVNYLQGNESIPAPTKH